MKEIYIQVRFNSYYQYHFGIYTAFLLDDKGNILENHISIKGKTLYPLLTGRCYRLIGKDTHDLRYGYTFEFKEAYETDIMGNKFIFEQEEMDRGPLMSPPPTKVEIYNSLYERISEDEKVRELVSYGVDFFKAQKLIEDEPEIVDHVKKDPYILMEIGTDFTFKECDIIAAKLKINPEDKYRIRTAIREVIKEICNLSGNTYVTINANLVNESQSTLSYQLTDRDIECVMNESKLQNSKLIDFEVYGFFYNTVDINELEKCVKAKKEYLFYEIDKKLIEDELLYSDEKITIVNNKIYLTEIFKAEKIIAEKIKNISRNKTGSNDINDIRNKIQIYENKNKISFTIEQIEAIEKILTPERGGFFILTGAAGTGKTTVIDAVLDINNYLPNPLTPIIGAPTGKAVKVLKDSIHSSVRVETIHRLLGFIDEKNFHHDETNPLWENFIIIDETSMLDTMLAANLLKAITDTSKVIFIGDPNQLPSIGPGRVLKDLLNCVDKSGILTLKRICRQANGSGIIDNSNNILEGNQISTSQDKNNFVIHGNSPELFKQRLIQGTEYLLKNGIKQSEIAVLTPMKMGSLGTYSLNKILQEKFNPNGLMPIEIEEISSKGCKPNKFKINDKVICTKNNYRIFKYRQPINRYNIEAYIRYCTGECIKTNQKLNLNDFREIGVVNGEDGIIRDIFETTIPLYDMKGRFRGREIKKCITVEFEDGFVCFYDTSDLRLGYAISIHKSQGSGWKGVITIMSQSHQKMACNELFYVANTRAREKNIFLIDKDLYYDNVLVFSNDRKTTLVETYKNI